MKPAPLALLFALFTSLALAAVNVWTGTFPSTSTTAPTSSSDGVSLVKSEGLRVMVCAPSGSSVDGGSLQSWYYDNPFGGWVRTPELDIPVPTSTGQRCINFGDLQPLVKEGRALWKPSGVVHLLPDAGVATDGGNIEVRVSTGVFQ